MLLLLVSQPGACPGPRTPSPSRTPARPSAPDALCDSWPRNLCSSRFFVWKRKVLFRLIFVWSNIWRIKRQTCSDETGVNWARQMSSLFCTLSFSIGKPLFVKLKIICEIIFWNIFTKKNLQFYEGWLPLRHHLLLLTFTRLSCIAKFILAACLYCVILVFLAPSIGTTTAIK